MLDVPQSSYLLQVALLGPSTTFLPARLSTSHQSILNVRTRGGYVFLMERLSEYLRWWDKWTGVSKPQYRERRYLIMEREPQKQVDRLVGRVICRRDLPMGKEELRLITAEAGMVHNIACAPEEVWFLEVDGVILGNSCGSWRKGEGIYFQSSGNRKTIFASAVVNFSVCHRVNHPHLGDTGEPHFLEFEATASINHSFTNLRGQHPSSPTHLTSSSFQNPSRCNSHQNCNPPIRH